MKRKLRRRRGKAPPDMAVAAQPGAQPWLHGIEINFKGTTAQDYVERTVPATPCSRREQLELITFAPESAVSSDNREAAARDLLVEFSNL